jgi:hypothetical protein
MDQVADSWKRGIKLSRTALHATGATVEVAVPFSINDLLAARHIGGFAGHNDSWLCSICKLYGRHHVWNTDWNTWPKREVDELRHAAERWRDAPTDNERNKIFEEEGVRWSEFWKLPYWNPILMLIIDVMHCLLEGLVQFYVRYVLRLVERGKNVQTTAFDYDWPIYNTVDCPPTLRIRPGEGRHIDHIHTALALPLNDDFTIETLHDRLKRKNLPPLRWVVHSLQLPFPADGDKEILIAILIEWVSSFHTCHFAPMLTFFSDLTSPQLPLLRRQLRVVRRSCNIFRG